LEKWNARRKALADIYRQTVTGARVELQNGGETCERVDHLFVVYVDDRDAVRARLGERGVQTGIHYPVPIHLQKPYQTLGYRAGDLPHAESACKRVISMPLYPEMSDEQARYTGEMLRETVGED
jgi:dTDP-4-amino-4,6-dideoxygalactose transaminase